MHASSSFARHLVAVIVAALFAACGGPAEDDAFDLASTSTPVCATATLTATQVGSIVTLTATSGCATVPEYRFLVRAPGEVAYALLNDYGPSATFQWDVAGRPSGLYQFAVHAREQGSSAVVETSITAVRLVGTTCSAAALNVSGVSGTTLTLAATATCTAGATPEFRFLVRAPGGAFDEVRPYGAGATFAWNTAGWPSGRYDVLVYARAAGNASAYEANATRAWVVGASCTSATLLTTPRPDGNFDLAASAVCSGGATPEFRFLFRAPGGHGFVEIRPYDTVATHVWDTTGLPAGKYDVVAYTRAAGNASTYEALGTSGALVGAVCTAATLTATRDATGRLDLAATATCAPGVVPEYRFMVRPPGGSPAELRAYSTASTFSTGTAGIASGWYEFGVFVRASGNDSPHEALAAATLVVGDVCTGASLTVTPGAGVVTLSAAATCGGAVPEYRFLVRPPGATGFVQLRAYGREPQLVVSTSGAARGTYAFLVYARAAGNLSQFEAAAERAYAIE